MRFQTTDLCYLAKALTQKNLWAMAFAIGASSVTGCLKGPSLFKQSASMSTSSALAPIQSDTEGVLSATISAASGSEQIVAASGSSAISAAKVTFPAGALALDTTITIEEGSALAGAAFTAELGSSTDLQVQSAGTPVVVTSSVPMDAASPFTLAIPTSSSGLRLTAEDSSLLVVIYKVYKAAEGRTVVGVIPNSELTIIDDTVSFATQHFGVYQAALADRPVEQKIEAATTTAILTKAQEQRLPEISWQAVKIAYDANTRKLSVSSQVDNMTPVRCTAFYDQQKAEPWEHVEDTAGKLSLDLVVPNDVNGTYYVALECGDAKGQISRSGWSAGVTIKAIPKSTTTTTSSGDLMITSIAPTNGASNIDPTASVAINFNHLVDLNTVSASTTTGNSVPATSVMPFLFWSDSNLPIAASINATTTATNGSKWVLTPQGNRLPLAAEINVIVPAGLKDQQGGVLKQTYNGNFLTRDGIWGTPAAGINMAASGGGNIFDTYVGSNGTTIVTSIELCETGHGTPGDYCAYAAINSGNGWVGANKMLIAPIGTCGPVNNGIASNIDNLGNIRVFVNYHDATTSCTNSIFLTRSFVNGAWMAAAMTSTLSANFSIAQILPKYQPNAPADYFLILQNGSSGDIARLNLANGVWSGVLSTSLTSLPTGLSLRPASNANKQNMGLGAPQMGDPTVVLAYITTTGCTNSECVKAAVSRDYGQTWLHALIYDDHVNDVYPFVDPIGNVTALTDSGAGPSYPVAKAYLAAGSSSWSFTSGTVTLNSNIGDRGFAQDDEGVIHVLDMQYINSKYTYRVFSSHQNIWVNNATPLILGDYYSSTDFSFTAAGHQSLLLAVVEPAGGCPSATQCIKASYVRSGFQTSATPVTIFDSVAPGYSSMSTDPPTLITRLDRSGNATIVVATDTSSSGCAACVLVNRSSKTQGWSAATNMTSKIAPLSSGYYYLLFNNQSTRRILNNPPNDQGTLTIPIFYNDTTASKLKVSALPFR